MFSAHERRLIEEKSGLVQEIDKLKGQLRTEQQRNEQNAEVIYFKSYHRISKKEFIKSKKDSSQSCEHM